MFASPGSTLLIAGVPVASSQFLSSKAVLMTSGCSSQLTGYFRFTEKENKGPIELARSAAQGARAAGWRPVVSETGRVSSRLPMGAAMPLWPSSTSLSSSFHSSVSPFSIQITSLHFSFVDMGPCMIITLLASAIPQQYCIVFYFIILCAFCLHGNWMRKSICVLDVIFSVCIVNVKCNLILWYCIMHPCGIHIQDFTNLQFLRWIERQLNLEYIIWINCIVFDV